MSLYVTAIVLTLESALAFQWLQYNHHFDFVAGVAVNETPISIGVFISTRTIITSANPLNQYLKNITYIKIHTVSKVYNNSTVRKVQSIAGNQSFRKKSWITIGFDKIHTSIHDVALINVVEENKIGNTSEMMNRSPFAVKLPKNISIWGMGWFFTGFGYLDKQHVEENTDLDVTYTRQPLVDCDEWLPREWGLFICLLNDERREVASGAPLFAQQNRRTVVGVGSFTLVKGKESVLVFTDLRPYVNKLYGYIKDLEQS